jgi:hypothetical protein
MGEDARETGNERPIRCPGTKPVASYQPPTSRPGGGQSGALTVDLEDAIFVERAEVSVDPAVVVRERAVRGRHLGIGELGSLRRAVAGVARAAARDAAAAIKLRRFSMRVLVALHK